MQAELYINQWEILQMNPEQERLLQQLYCGRQREKKFAVK
jgi:hypothetical protein